MGMLHQLWIEQNRITLLNEEGGLSKSRGAHLKVYSGPF